MDTCEFRHSTPTSPQLQLPTMPSSGPCKVAFQKLPIIHHTITTKANIAGK